MGTHNAKTQRSDPVGSLWTEALQGRAAAELDEGHREDVGEEQQQHQGEEPQAGREMGRWWALRAFFVCVALFFGVGLKFCEEPQLGSAGKRDN